MSRALRREIEAIAEVEEYLRKVADDPMFTPQWVLDKLNAVKKSLEEAET